MGLEGGFECVIGILAVNGNVFIRCPGCVFRRWLRGSEGREGDRDLIVKEEVEEAAEDQDVAEDSYAVASSHS